MDREAYREQARFINRESALVIRHPGGLYFAGFGRPPEHVKWTGTLADAKMFNATAQSQLNEGNVKRHHFQRLNDLIAAAGRRRITYKELTA